MASPWYIIDEADRIDSPALVIYLDRVKKNIRTLLTMIDDPSRLRPHVKTNKSPDVTRLLLDAGITKFKCATISEAEMLGQVNAPDVLLAYQPVGPKVDRFLELGRKYPDTTFSCLVDNPDSAAALAESASAGGQHIPVFIDLNVGMNRTGIRPGEEAIRLAQMIRDTEGIFLRGLHAYDGHIRAIDIKERTQLCDAGFQPVQKMQTELEKQGFELTIVAGGSPTFPIHARRGVVECSPGTFVFWDKGYKEICPEQDFEPAALVLSRVISHPADHIFCLDLGHKSIAPENPLNRRVYFLNAPDLEFIGQSEEHLPVRAPADQSLQVGDLLYGVPIHICPTVALHDQAWVVENGKILDRWKIVARDRTLSV